MRALLIPIFLLALSSCAESDSADPDWLAGRDMYATCAACHGKAGEGGVGPALTTVLETFPGCDTQVKWISLGSQGWKQEVGESYGATGKPVTGVMPAFDYLSETERRQVAVYERVRFGGADLEAERKACGLG